MKRFKEIIFENWSLKLTAVLLSLLLWLFVRGEPGPARVITVPLEVQVPRNMEITNERPSTVEVTMRGAAFSNMWFGQTPHCMIDLQGASEGEHLVTVSPKNIRVPKGAGTDILQVNPSRVLLILERTVSKEVPIVVPLKGEPARGYEIQGKFSRPSATIVTGPRSRVNPIEEVQTESINVSGQKQAIRSFVNLNMKDNLIRTSAPEPVQVDIEIGLRRKTYTISPVPVRADNTALVTVPKEISIQVIAPVDLRKEISPDDFKVTVSTGNLDLSKLPIRVKPLISIAGNLNGAVAIKEASPSEVIVRKSGKK